jgi:hypothetical protein
MTSQPVFRLHLISARQAGAFEIGDYSCHSRQNVRALCFVLIQNWLALFSGDGH